MTMLRGKRIYLRPVTLEDVTDRYRSWLNDPEVNRFLETRFYPQELEDIRRFVSTLGGKSDEPFFAICLNESGRHIGNIKLGPINPHHRSADVSLLIGEKDCWGRGYATEAIALISNHAIEDLHLNKLKAGCYALNEGSARAFEKCGWQREGLLRSQVFYAGAKWM